MSFITKLFTKKNNITIPIISITLFIITIILNSIQYIANDRRYLQNNIGSDPLLYIYDFIGINGFMNNGLLFIFYFILTYVCLALVELNIGIIRILFLLCIGIIFHHLWDICQDFICGLRHNSYNVNNSGYCCGSCLLFMALGSLLFIAQHNTNNIFYRMILLIIILGVVVGCVLYDESNNYYGLTKYQAVCRMLTWHTAFFLFGICCGFVLGK